MKRCPICGKHFNLIDWPSHNFSEHMTEEQRERIRRRLAEEQERDRKPLPPDEEVFKGFMEEK